MANHKTGQPARLSTLMSSDMADLFLAGIIVEHDPDGAELWGAFEETALDAAAAWDANGDLDLSQA